MSEQDQVLPSQAEELGPGALLARARAERQLSVAQVAERLKYGARQIEALESDDYAHLPGTTFVRGMVRGYARLVGMDAGPVLKALERRNIPAPATVDLRPQRIPFPDGSKRGTRLYVALSAIALVAIVAVLYEWHLAESAPPLAAVAPPPVPVPISQPEAVPPAPEHAAVPGMGVSGAPGGTLGGVAARSADGAKVKLPPGRVGGARIQLDFQRESWVEIKDRGGRTLLSQLNSAGTQKVIEGAPPFSVIIGNAASVRLRYNDVPVDLRPHVKVEVARLTLE